MKQKFLLIVAFLMAVCSYAQEKNSATPSNFGPVVATKGGTVRVPITITNTGSNVIKTVAYTITKDGEESASKTVSLNSLAVGASGQVNIAFQADAEPRKSTQTININKVNGVTNTSSQKSATGNIITLKEKPIVIPVVEEFTGTWCGWCPIGFDGMERAHETFGDKAALIAIHYGDPMETSDFSFVLQRAEGFPSALLNRGASTIYPAASELKSKINSELQNQVSPVSIEVYAEWTSNVKRVIRIDTKTTFVYSDDNADYGIAYALTEDGMSGTASGWTQNNNLSGDKNYASSIPYWYNAPQKATGVKFNHVGVAAWGIEKGIDGSINPVVQANEPQEYTYEAKIAGNSLIQNKANLKVIVMLIDRSTGAIVNAAQTTIANHDATGIIGESIARPEDESAPWFTLNGTKLSAKPTRSGIYIQNGKKVWVR
ncbi:MAG: Omp28-related outer membrane protein [Bacteroidaceae bacterium]|nr:Omp28-related outer membrane protein [Bacteroidaceae bacterium]